MSAPNWIKTATMQSVTSAERTTTYMRQMSVMSNAGRSISQKRKGLILALLLLSSIPAFAQGTIMPPPIFTGLDGSGNPLVSGKLCTYEAGTSTPATTYSTSALDPLTANSNPVILNAAGRAIVFLRPGSSYKFVLYSAGSDTTCNTGTLQWSSDNISAVPSSNVNLDLEGTAGESLSAGDAVFLSNGTGGLSAGQWYKTDSDLTYKSTSATMVGIAPNAITSGASGSIRVAGVATLTGPLSTGAPQYVGATPGTIVATPPTNALRIGTANSATSLIIGFTQAPVSPRGPPCGRLTLTSGLPVTITDVTAATTLYYTPAGSCNTIDLYDGTSWATYAFAQVSIAVPATTNTMYDVFAYDNAGVVALELTAWTNDTTRATALVLQNGVYAKTGALTRRYLGSFRTTAVSGQTEDSVLNRLVWNYYNRADRMLRVTDATNSWSYSLAVWHQANASAANQVTMVIGVSEDIVTARVDGWAVSTTSNDWAQVAIGVDSTTVFGTGSIAARANIGSENSVHGSWQGFPGVGYHYLAWLESTAAGGTTTWYGDNNTPTLTQTGLQARVPM